MKLRLAVIASLVVALFAGRARADEEDHPPEAAQHEEAPAEPEPHHEQAAPEPAEHHADAPAPEAPRAEAEAVSDDEADPDDARDSKFDLDGDGHDDPALEQEYNAAFAGIKPEIDSDAVDKELAARPADAELTPSISVEQFRKIVGVVRKVVLAKMEKKMARSTAKKMAQFSKGIGIFSLAGLLLLLIPLVYAKKYPGPGKRATLFKYSALAAITFLVTVNLFGGVLYGMKAVQGKLGNQTNPSLAIARGTFDTLDERADEFITMGKELFVPTLEQLQGSSDEQPSVLLLENGKKIVKQANVFISIAKMFKKLDFIFKVLPIILFAVTMILFGLAIKPTLTEIVRLPMRAAAGEAGVAREVTANAMRRVLGEFKAALCTIGVLAVMTLLSGFVLGKVATPALFALLSYFAAAVSYLQFVESASAGLVFLALFGVILFLVLSLACLILSMSFFLGKCQKIFQARFNREVPIHAHAHFFRWGIPSVLLVQVFPWVFVVIAGKILDVINEKLLANVKDADAVPWGKLMLAGPLFLVVGYIALFWAARGIAAIKFLFRYKV